MKKAFRSQLLEFCEKRTKKSNRDMFNLSLVLAGHDMITDAGRATAFRRKTYPNEYKQEYKR